MRNRLERTLSAWTRRCKETAGEDQARSDSDAGVAVGVEIMRKRWLREVFKRQDHCDVVMDRVDDPWLSGLSTRWTWHCHPAELGAMEEDLFWNT